MKKSTGVLFATVAALAAAPALAGGPLAVAAEPVPVVAAPAAPAHDWTGFYAGIGYGRLTDSTLSYPTNTPPSDKYDLHSGSAPSIFLGYQFQNGNLVYGGELAYTRISKKTYPYRGSASSFPEESPRSAIDAKARVGYAANRVLVYATAGYSSAKYKFDASPDESYTATGWNAGIGADYAVTDRFTVGLEYLARRVDGNTGMAGTKAKLHLNTITLRGAFRF